MKIIAHFLLWILTLFLTLSAFAFLPGPAGFLSLLLIAVIIPLEEWQSFLGKYTRRWLRPLAAAALSLVLFFSASFSPLPSLPADPPGSAPSHSIGEQADSIPSGSTGTEATGMGSTIPGPTGEAVGGVVGDGSLVWIPTRGGIKYHTNAQCSDMIDPVQVTIPTAVSQGFDPCKKCYS